MDVVSALKKIVGDAYVVTAPRDSFNLDFGKDIIDAKKDGAKIAFVFGP